MSKGPIIILGLAAVGLGVAATMTSAANSSPAKRPPPPPPKKQDKVQASADSALEKLRGIKAKADEGDKKAQDTIKTLKDLYGRLKS